MMDIVLGGAMGLVLAVLLSNPPRPKVRAVKAQVVEDQSDAASGAKGKGGKKK